MIVVDSREKADFSDISSEKKMLDIGDFHILVENGEDPKLIVERKTVADYSASIKDGRLHEQEFRMKECGVQCVYIVEGNLNEDYGIDPEAIKNSTVNKVIHSGIPVFYSSTLETTKSILKRLEKSVLSKDKSLEKRSTYLSNSKIKKCTESNSFEMILMTIPGVSNTTAGVIKNQYGTLPNLMKELEKEGPSCLSNLSLGSKKIGKLSEKIYKYLGF